MYPGPLKTLKIERFVILVVGKAFHLRCFREFLTRL